MLSPATLRTISLQKICSFLKSGIWENCEENPFSSLPTSVVQDLLSSLLSTVSELTLPVAHLRMLLTSGRLGLVDVSLVESNLDYSLMFHMLSRGCQNLRTLILKRLMAWSTRIGEPNLQKLLQNCTNLEEFHSNVYFDPDALWNCRKLRSLKLHFSSESAVHFFSRTSSALLERLEYLEVFALCSPARSRRAFALHLVSPTLTILDNCPQLTSLGFVDSSMALKELHDRDRGTLGTPRFFQLHKCYWVPPENIAQSVYCDIIRVATMSCPLVEGLEIVVRDTGSVKYLKNLKKLTFLDISFVSWSYENKHEFYSLLNVIGPQLQYLSIHADFQNSFHLNLICDSCPNLSTLLLDCKITADEAIQPCVNLLHLKLLRVTHCNTKSLLFLLSNCLELKVLCLKYCEMLEDGLLQAILQKNSFAKLEVAFVYFCGLSKLGLKQLVQSAGKLKKICVESRYIDYDEVVGFVRDLNPNVACLNTIFRYDFIVVERKEFCQTDDWACWL